MRLVDKLEHSASEMEGATSGMSCFVLCCINLLPWSSTEDQSQGVSKVRQIEVAQNQHTLSPSLPGPRTSGYGFGSPINLSTSWIE